MAPNKTTVVMLICADWIPHYLCTPQSCLYLGARIKTNKVRLSHNVNEGSSHRGGMLTPDHPNRAV